MPTREQITDFIRDWVKQNMEYEGFTDILQLRELGLCGDLAHFIWEHFNKDNTLNARNTGDHNKLPYHVWIEHNGIHYDMQNPEGVQDWKQLLYFQELADPQELAKTTLTDD